jgi:hypothetical protein
MSSSIISHPSPRLPSLLLQRAAVLLLLILFRARCQPLLMLLPVLLLLRAPTLLLLFHTRHPTALAPLPARPNDADSRRQRK